MAQFELQQALSFEEDFWREKSRLNWRCYGDKNTDIFYRVNKLRYASKSMSLLKNGDAILEDPSEIAQHVLNYYSSLYATSNDCQPNDLINRVVVAVVTKEYNNFLTKLPSFDEIKDTVYALHGDGARGPYDFGGCFFPKLLIVGLDVCK